MNLSDSLVCWALAGRHLGRDQGLRLAHRQREHLVHPPLDLGRDPRERAGPLAGPRHQHLALGVPVGLGAHQHQQDGPGFPQPAQALAQRPHGRERGLAAHAPEHREAVAVADVQVLERDQVLGVRRVHDFQQRGRRVCLDLLAEPLLRPRRALLGERPHANCVSSVVLPTSRSPAAHPGSPGGARDQPAVSGTRRGGEEREEGEGKEEGEGAWERRERRTRTVRAGAGRGEEGGDGGGQERRKEEEGRGGETRGQGVAGLASPVARGRGGRLLDLLPPGLIPPGAAPTPLSRCSRTKLRVGRLFLGAQ
ncbi:uncharacterized protein LOC124903391 [Homo sapiens]|uniref:uncharacterized protein LOC124903391 n=1 Tax=Homo sapiens TaxID=9606 RepID=UPI001FB18B21|nr:uncharacterized protein LOC124903391 [Homo sapiens]XP_047288000.1 uncharacterized protein LOC124903391 [Homo sapiens]